nr:hypothetical protein [Oceaniradius stylonematis]
MLAGWVHRARSDGNCGNFWGIAFFTIAAIDTKAQAATKANAIEPESSHRVILFEHGHDENVVPAAVDEVMAPHVAFFDKAELLVEAARVSVRLVDVNIDLAQVQIVKSEFQDLVHRGFAQSLAALLRIANVDAERGMAVDRIDPIELGNARQAASVILDCKQRLGRRCFDDVGVIPGAIHFHADGKTETVRVVSERPIATP